MVLEKVKEFCQNHGYIYIFGAGAYGKTLHSVLDDEGISIKGFVVSNKKEVECKTALFSYDEYKKTVQKKDGIIIAVNEKLKNDILITYNFGVDILTFSDAEFDELSLERCKKIFSKYTNKAEKQINISSLQSILVVQYENTFGDMIWTTALLKAIHNKCPKSEITYVINPAFNGIFKNCPYVSSIINYSSQYVNEPISLKMEEYAKKFVKEKLNKKYDAVFLPRFLPSFGTDIWENVLIAINVDADNIFAHAIGYHKFGSEIAEFLASKMNINIDRIPVHSSYSDLMLLGSDTPKIPMELWPSKNLVNEVNKFLLTKIDKGAKVVVVGLSGSKSTRAWAAEKYRLFFNKSDELFGKRFVYVLCGKGNIAEDAINVIGKLPENCINVVGNTSFEYLIALFANADLYLGPNTGFLHIASAFKMPSITLYSTLKTCSPEYGGSKERTGRWMAPGVDLFPPKGADNECEKAGYCLKPYSHCINGIEVEEVINAIKDWYNSDSKN